MDVVHTNDLKDHFYGVTTVNGNTIESDSLIVKINLLNDGHLAILKKLPEGELNGLYYQNGSEGGVRIPDYPKCRKNATYSKDALHFDYENSSQ